MPWNVINVFFGTLVLWCNVQRQVLPFYAYVVTDTSFNFCKNMYTVPEFIPRHKWGRLTRTPSKTRAVYLMKTRQRSRIRQQSYLCSLYHQVFCHVRSLSSPNSFAFARHSPGPRTLYSPYMFAGLNFVWCRECSLPKRHTLQKRQRAAYC